MGETQPGDARLWLADLLDRVASGFVLAEDANQQWESWESTRRPSSRNAALEGPLPENPSVN